MRAVADFEKPKGSDAAVTMRKPIFVNIINQLMVKAIIFGIAFLVWPPVQTILVGAVA